MLSTLHKVACHAGQSVLSTGEHTDGLSSLVMLSIHTELPALMMLSAACVYKLTIM